MPIIFVPGVMGTRLHFTSVDEYWDPDSTWRMLHWVRISAERARREMHWSEPATVLATHADLTAGQRRRGWAGMVTDFYVPFLTHLEGVTFPCARTTVWAVGYDWRQGNRDSGVALDEEITRILGVEESEEYVLISHSMGGLVSRACLKDHAGNAARLLGVVHVFQPAQGATVFYRRMYTGAIPSIDGGRGLSMIMGTTPGDFATLLSGLMGPCELMPNNSYRHAGGDWLWGPPRRSNGTVLPPAPYTGDMFGHYRSASAPPCITWSITGLPVTHLTSRVNRAAEFHAWLGSYKHPRTWAIYGTGLTTDVQVSFADATAAGVRMVRLAEGDGTVPSSSASALFTAAETSTDATGMEFVRDRSKKQFEASGVDHAAAFNDAGVRTVVRKQILLILGCVPQITGPAQAVTYQITVKYGDFEALLDPFDSVRGRQQRLQAIGFYHGEIDGDDGEITQRCWRHFREEAGPAGQSLSEDAALVELKNRYRAILRVDDGNPTAQADFAGNARLVLPGTFCYARDPHLGNPLFRHRYSAEQDFFDSNPALNRVPIVAHVTVAGTGAPAPGVRVAFELVPPYESAEDQKAYLSNISAATERTRSPRGFVRNRLPAGPNPPYGFNCPTEKGGETPADAAGAILSTDPTTGFPWTPGTDGRPSAFSVTCPTDAKGEAGVLLRPSRQAGDAYRIRVRVIPDGRAPTAEESKSSGVIVIWRNLRIARVVQKASHGAFTGAPPVAARMTGPLGTIEMRVVRKEVTKAFMVLESDRRAERAVVMSADGYREAIESARKGAANPQNFDLNTLVKTDAASPFLFWLETAAAYNQKRTPGSTALDLTVAATWSHIGDLITSLRERFVRYWGGGRLPGMVIIRSEVGDSYSYWNHPNKPVYNDGSAWVATTSGVATRFRGCYVWYPLSIYTNNMPYGLTQNTMHEAGHVLYLRHHYTSGVAGTEAGGFAANHDGKDWCLMGYLALTTNDFCGKCLLKLRGWDERKV